MLDKLKDHEVYEFDGFKLYFPPGILEILQYRRDFPRNSMLEACSDYIIDIETGKVVKNRWGRIDGK